MQVGDLLHTEPAKLTAADGAGHVITTPVVHFDDVGSAARARLDVVTWRHSSRSSPRVCVWDAVTLRGGGRKRACYLGLRSPGCD